jgi:periplasmic protein CpxP/Spy
MKNKVKWISTAAAVVALSSTLAFAAPHEGGKRGGRHGKHGQFAGERLAAKLNLTDAQKAQLESQRQSFKQQNATFFEQSRETRKAYREAREANDTAKVQSLQPSVDAAKAQMKSLRDAQREQFLSILTADQRAQYDALKAERKDKRERR